MGWGADTAQKTGMASWRAQSGDIQKKTFPALGLSEQAAGCHDPEVAAPLRRLRMRAGLGESSAALLWPRPWGTALTRPRSEAWQAATSGPRHAGLHCCHAHCSLHGPEQPRTEIALRID